VIDSYPSTKKDQEILLSNLTKLKNQNFEVLLTSHHVCNPEIIELCDYFLFEKRNNFYFKDSDIISDNLKNIPYPIFETGYVIEDITLLDRIVNTSWSVSITSQFFNSVNFLRSKGYEYAFYLISDCIIPEDFYSKINEIISKSEKYDNYFIQYHPQFCLWYTPHLFGFSLNDDLIKKIPTGDFSEISTYQKHFPNHCFEDIILNLFNHNKNYIESHDTLNYIFGEGNWDKNKSTTNFNKDEYSLHLHTVCSIFFSEECDEFILVLRLSGYSPYYCVDIEIEISDDIGQILYHREIKIYRGCWFMDNLDYIFTQNESVIFNKKIVDETSPDIIYRDRIIIKKDYYPKYSLLKRFFRNV